MRVASVVCSNRYDGGVYSVSVKYFWTTQRLAILHLRHVE